MSLILALLPGIGFWVNTHRDKTQNAKYLLQIEPDSFAELATNSTYPAFTSSYYIRRGETNPSQVNVPIVDPECYADFYLVCLDSKKGKYKKLFDCMHEGTVL